jgi:hypothetical protein
MKDEYKKTDPVMVSIAVVTIIALIAIVIIMTGLLN